MQIDTNNDAPNKPVVSGTSRNNRMDMVGLNKREGYYTRGSFTREDSKGRKQSPNVIKNRKS